MAGRKPWKCSESDRIYTCKWIARRFGEDESRASLAELNSIISDWPDADREALKSAIRQRRRRAAQPPMFKNKTIELDAEAFAFLFGEKLPNENYSQCVIRLLKP